jgi:hypothetical protein
MVGDCGALRVVVVDRIAMRWHVGGRGSLTVPAIIRRGSLMTNLSVVVHQLKREHRHLQNQLQRIDAAIMALMGANSNAASRMSAAGRRRISLAQKARWSKQRTAKPKRTLSAAGRKRIVAAQKARWAKVKRAA